MRAPWDVEEQILRVIIEEDPCPFCGEEPSINCRWCKGTGIVEIEEEIRTEGGEDHALIVAFARVMGIPEERVEASIHKAFKNRIMIDHAGRCPCRDCAEENAYWDSLENSED